MTSHNVLLEPRWRAGVWLGRRWGSCIHQVFDADDGQIHQVRAVQRRPITERWSLEAVQTVTAVPRVLRQPAEAGEPEPIVVLPPAEAPELQAPPAPPGRAPNRVFIEDADLRKCGYTAGCPRCMHMRAGLPCRGIKHREACRNRVEGLLREANDPRIRAADERWATRVVAHGDPSLPASAVEGSAGNGAETAGGGPASAGDPPAAGDEEQDTAQAGTAQAGGLEPAGGGAGDSR